MAKPKSVVDLLRALPGDELSGMRERIGAEIERHTTEIARLQTELALVEEAQSRTRRRVRATDETASSRRGRANGRAGIPRAALVRYVREFGRPVHPTELSEFLATKGISIGPKALHTGLTRLEKVDAKLIKTGPSTWGLPEWRVNGSEENAADDPLSRDDERQSQDSEARLES